MECRMCGHEFDPKKSKNHCDCGCKTCDCNLAFCPNCGYGNVEVYESEFKFIKQLKAKLKA